jgi:hypothetical protein
MSGASTTTTTAVIRAAAAAATAPGAAGTSGITPCCTQSAARCLTAAVCRRGRLRRICIHDICQVCCVKIRRDFRALRGVNEVPLRFDRNNRSNDLMSLLRKDFSAGLRLRCKVPTRPRVGRHAAGAGAALHLSFDFRLNCNDFIRCDQSLSPPCCRHRHPRRPVVIFHDIAVSAVHPQQ